LHKINLDGGWKAGWPPGKLANFPFSQEFSTITILIGGTHTLLQMP